MASNVGQREASAMRENDHSVLLLLYVTNELPIMERGIIMSVNTSSFIMDRGPDGDYPTTQNPPPPIFPLPSIHPTNDTNECATNVSVRMRGSLLCSDHRSRCYRSLVQGKGVYSGFRISVVLGWLPVRIQFSHPDFGCRRQWRSFPLFTSHRAHRSRWSA